MQAYVSLLVRVLPSISSVCHAAQSSSRPPFAPSPPIGAAIRGGNSPASYKAVLSMCCCHLQSGPLPTETAPTVGKGPVVHGDYKAWLRLPALPLHQVHISNALGGGELLELLWGRDLDWLGRLGGAKLITLAADADHVFGVEVVLSRGKDQDFRCWNGHLMYNLGGEDASRGSSSRGVESAACRSPDAYGQCQKQVQAAAAKPCSPNFFMYLVMKHGCHASR